METGDTEARDVRAAMSALERVIRHASDHPHEDLSEATRALVRLRDELIRRKHAGGAPDRLRGELDQVNSVLSIMHGSTFPLVGIRLQRIEKARDRLAELLKDA